MRIQIDGRWCVDKNGFAALLGIGVHSSLDTRRRRDLIAGIAFPEPYKYVHGHPFWLEADAERYALDRVDQRTRGRTRLRKARRRETAEVLAESA